MAKTEEERKQIEKYKRQKEIERARKARARDRASNKIITSNYDDTIPYSSAAANAMKQHLPPPPPITTNMTNDTPKAAKEKEMVACELAELREMKLTNKFYKQFTQVIESISKERAVSEAALAEFERKKAENAAYYAARGESTPLTTLTTMEKISVELRRRNEIIRKKEAHTKELYHRYTKAKRAMSGLHINDLELPPLPEEIVRQMDILSKNETPTHLSKTKVAETLRQYEAPPTPERRRKPRGNWTPTSFQRSGSNLSFKSIAEEDNTTLLEKVRVKAEAADADAVLEESELQASLAETNALSLKKAMAWLTENKMIKSPADVGMSFDNISEIGDSDLGDDDDSYMAKSLAAFLIQEAGNNVNQEEYTFRDEESCTSQSLQDDTSAVLAAEKAAKEMADAVSFTSSITADTFKSKQDPKHEKWYAYWSKEYQREYYYEPKTQKVTWTPPDSYSVTSSFKKNDEASVTSSHSMPSVNTMTSDTRSQQWSSPDFTPSVDSSLTRSQTIRLRTIALRRSRRKRFVRRTLWTLATALLIATSSTYYAYHNDMLSDTHRHYASLVFDTIHDQLQIIRSQFNKNHNTQPVLEPTQTKPNKLPSKISPSVPNTPPTPKIVQPSSPKKVFTKTTKNEKKDVVTKITAPTTTETKKNLPAVVTTIESEITPSKELSLTTSQQEKQDQKKNQIMTKEQEKLAKLLEKSRPKHCFIPLAYIFSKNCRILAKEKPVFNLREFINSMMQ